MVFDELVGVGLEGLVACVVVEDIGLRVRVVGRGELELLHKSFSNQHTLKHINNNNKHKTKITHNLTKKKNNN